ncbi:acyl-CoA thioesterase [Sulfitobacter albidus]|uniref:Acyl-CoA thioesterase n=1 Tax=Sulfitobacter albidus TaxID=2829501 RepID=A0A975PN15_9RHOB|nr:thioesterase family protein [Sulfitobacter albidus]QUJ76986.1 acyl-CoA thioesterase [Sulfitobacter albidus]
MAFDFPQKVLFKHCDPAGIVFYPRYFEMINDCVEAFFSDVIGVPFEVLLRDGGVPTAEIAVKFRAPSRHGDRLILSLEPVTLTPKSFALKITATCAGEVRFVSDSTLVYVGSDGRAAPWPDAILTPLIQFSEDTP